MEQRTPRRDRNDPAVAPAPLGWLQRIGQTRVPLLVAHAVLGVVFIEMGAHKWMDPMEFLKQLRQYHLLPESPPYWMNLTAIVLPALEVVCGLALLCGLWVRSAGAMALGMLVVFTVAVTIRAVGVYHDTGQPFCSIAFDCGCGAGVIAICKKVPENVGLIILSLIVVASRTPLASLKPLVSPSAPDG